MNQKKYRIAFSGVFDLANYGDHLFPLIFEAEMRKMELDVELCLFSPLKGSKAFDPNIEVFSLDDLESKHLENQFDAIIVAGGELIHFMEFPQKLDISAKEFMKYTISKTWVIPSIVAGKYNIRLLWNLPGVPFHFHPPFSHLLKMLCANIDYLSVRNQFSKEVLIECGIEDQKINIYPDTAFKISEILDHNNLNEIRSNIRQINGKYIIFHSNRFIPEDEIPVVINSLSQLQEEGYKIVLLPLAYTHGDDTILSEINIKAKNRFILIDHVLSIEEMISILAGCELYIGVSFHGAITAAAFGRKVISYDFMENHKTKDLFSMMQQEVYYCNHADKLSYLIKQTMLNDVDINIKGLQKQLDLHFQNIKYTLCNEKIENRVNVITNEYVNAIRELIQQENTINYNLNSKNTYISELEAGIKWHLDHDEKRESRIKELEAGIKWHLDHDEKREARIKELEAGIIWHLDHDEKRETRIKELEDGINWHLNFEAEKDRASMQLVDKLEKSELQTNELRAKIFYMESSLSWKMTSWMRKKK